MVYGFPSGIVVAVALVGADAVLGQATFTDLPSVAQGLPSLAVARACFDAGRGLTVLVGSAAQQRQTWEWNGSSFTLRHTVAFAVPVDYQIAFDRVRGVTVFVDGDGVTREWNGVAWSTIGGAGFAPPRYGAALAFDGQRIVRFGGGVVGSSVSNETWSYDGVAWAQLTPAQSPPPSTAMIFQPQLLEDRRRGRLVMVSSLMPSIWEWDGVTWSSVATVPWTGFPGRQDFLAAFHPARGRVVIAGGLHVSYVPFYSTSPVADAWEWDGTTFTPLPDVPRQHLAGVLAPTPDGDLLAAFGSSPSLIVNTAAATLQSVNPAEVATFGAGCAGSAGVPSLGADPWSWPWIGDTLEVRSSNLSATATAALWVLGLSNTQDAFGLLPRDLAWAGAAGCAQRVAADLSWVEAVQNGASTWTAGLPPAAGLVGLQFYLQVLALDAAANPGGFVLSDAAQARIGSR